MKKNNEQESLFTKEQLLNSAKYKNKCSTSRQ